jgi:hypothetical protein
MSGAMLPSVRFVEGPVAEKAGDKSRVGDDDDSFYDSFGPKPRRRPSSSARRLARAPTGPGASRSRSMDADEDKGFYDKFEPVKEDEGFSGGGHPEWMLWKPSRPDAGSTDATLVDGLAELLVAAEPDATLVDRLTKLLTGGS